MSTNDGGYAFPRPLPTCKVPPEEALEIWRRHSGMTLRDYFAGKAMEGMLANPNTQVRVDISISESMTRLAQLALSLADAMLKAREK